MLLFISEQHFVSTYITVIIDGVFNVLQQLDPLQTMTSNMQMVPTGKLLVLQCGNTE